MAKDTVMLTYITASNRDEAVKLARVLVEERLAACANVYDGITSFYWWEGKVQQEGEVSLLVKTRADLLEALTARVRELHTYTVPCVVSWPIAGGNETFLTWIREETRGG
jgi:periplasmic divalent cation tolerance protein